MYHRQKDRQVKYCEGVWFTRELQGILLTQSQLRECFNAYSHQ